MTRTNIIKKLSEWRDIKLPDENSDFAIIINEIERLSGIEAHGAKAIRSLILLEKLIWLASKEYHKK